MSHNISIRVNKGIKLIKLYNWLLINPYYSVENFFMLEDISIRRGMPIRLLSENIILLKVLINQEVRRVDALFNPGGRDPVAPLQATTGT